VKQATGSVRYRAARGAFEVRVRPGEYERQRSYYVKGPNDATTRAEAERLRVAKLAEAHAGVRPINRTMTVDAWLDHWLELKSRKRPATRRAYERRFALYVRPFLGRRKLADLDELDVARWLRQLEAAPGIRTEHVSASTIAAAFKAFNAAMNDARRARRIPANPCELQSVDRSEAEIVPPSIAEVDAILEELVGDPLYPAFLLLRWSGMREGELFGLRWSDVDLDARVVSITRQHDGAPLKSRAARRSLVVPSLVVDALRGHPRRLGSELVFSTSSGRPLDQRNFLRAFDAACERAGVRPPAGSDRVKYRVHDLRHAFATTFLEAGAPPVTVQAWLGHSSLRMLDRYGHVRTIAGGEAYRHVRDAFGDDASLLLASGR